MPKEFRKRGKRSKKSQKDDDEGAYIVYAQPEEKERRKAALAGEEYDEEALVAKEHARRLQQQQEERQQLLEHGQDLAYDGGADHTAASAQPESIWPPVDPDTKAYFRQLEEKILELEDLGIGSSRGRQSYTEYGEDGQEAGEDDRVLLLRAALTELSGRETALATDPETSVILERLLYSMDDFARRVLADRFTGQYKELSKDRFASHVLQTLLVLGGGETVERERRGNIASGPSFGSAGGNNLSDTGELPTLTDSIVGFIKELMEDLSSVVSSQHGSYILRTLLIVVSGKPLPFNSQTVSSAASGGAAGRSKKSAKWKANRVGAMKSFLPPTSNMPGNVVTNTYHDPKGKAPEKRLVPSAFSETLQELMQAIDLCLSDGHAKDTKESAQQCRMRSDDPVTTGLVQILLELEVDAGKSEKPYSMMDRLLEGLITAFKENPSLGQPARSDYIETLLRSTVSSHVLEQIITLSSQPIFDLLFKMYFQGRIARLAGHPVANFVTARVVERANKEQTELVVDEIAEALAGCIENSRTGAVQALLEKCAKYKTKGDDISKSLCNAFQTRNDADYEHILPCGLALMTLALYRRNPAYTDPTVKPEQFMQGSLLLQAWLRVPGSPVAQSVLRTPIERLLSFTSDPIAARVIDVFLDEDISAVTLKDRRQFLKNLIGHYHKLADDRIGSRIADRCWQVADPFLKDKIASSLLRYENQLQASHFGHYFLRKVNLPLFRRDPRDWRDRQAKDIGGTPAELHARAAKQKAQQEAVALQKQAALEAQRVETPSEADPTGKKGKKDKKRKKDRADEIDELFQTVKRGKVDASSNAEDTSAAYAQKSAKKVDDAILEALKSASKATRKS